MIWLSSSVLISLLKDSREAGLLKMKVAELDERVL
jgi:hypothetical protein